MNVTQIAPEFKVSAPRLRYVFVEVVARLSHPVLRRDRCSACGTCRLLCPSGAIAPAAGEDAAISYGECTGCGVCAAVCPACPPAIEMKLGSAPADA